MSFFPTDNIIKPAFTYDPNTDPQQRLLAPDRFWRQNKVEINSTQPFRISFNVTSYSFYTYLAIDDITYRPGSCNPTTATTPKPTLPPTVSPDNSLSCTFENNNVCNWKKGFNWFITSGNDGFKKFDLMPKIDHTRMNGYSKYAYISHDLYDEHASISEITANMTATDTTYVPYQDAIPMCFTLWYYMRTTVYVQLNITVKTPQNYLTKSIMRERDQGDLWHKLQFETFEDRSGYVLTISAYARYGINLIHLFKMFSIRYQ